jgi:outer membrane protein OmpA-like peptidoglycan-associated protein
MKFIRGQTKIDSSVLKGAQVQIKDLKTKKITYATVDTSNGEFTMAVKKNSKVMVTVKKDNVAFNSFIIDGNATPQGSLNLQTQHLVKGGRFILENIYYRSSSAEIDSSSFIILESLADYLKEHPKIKIEIGGHTDNIGSDADNTLLSKNRADAVRNHLLQLGVKQDRISAKGYGASRSRSTNSTAEGRAQNRRTEFSVIQL